MAEQDHVDGCHNAVDVHARYVMFSNKFGDPCECPRRAYDRVLDTEKLTIRELHAALMPQVEAIDDGHEYFSVSCRYDDKGERSDARANQPIGRYRWIAVYAVTGTSEGHYVHVDRLYTETYASEYKREALMLVKTFGGWETACKIAALLGERLGA